MAWSCSTWHPLNGAISLPIGIQLLKVNNGNTRTRRRSGIFIINFEYISHLVLVFLLLTLINQKATHLDLLEVLPKLHCELLECASTVGQVDCPAFPSLKDSQIDPWNKELPCGKEIGVAIAAAISYCNKDVLENYLKALCKEMEIILRQQRGNTSFLAHFYQSIFIFG